MAETTAALYAAGASVGICAGSPRLAGVIPLRVAPAELLFEFVRASDRAPMSCELRFHGEVVRLGGAVLRTRRALVQPRRIRPARAVQWAEEERKAMTRVVR